MSDDIRELILWELEGRGLSATPQAVNALIAAATQSSVEVTGDSDSLLLGLLSCGSYTLDLLRDAGAKVDQLLGDSAQSAANYYTSFAAEGLYPIESLFAEGGNFGQLILRPELRHRPIEASDLLQEAVSPLTEGRLWYPRPTLTSEGVPKELGDLRIANELNLVVDEALSDFGAFIWANPEKTMRERSKPLSNQEFERLKEGLNDDRDAASIVATALNRYLVAGKLPTDDFAFVAMAVGMTGSIGSNHFVSGGGRYHDLSLSLRTSRRFAPERDEPSLTMFEEDGKIVVAHFSYRGTGAIVGGPAGHEILSVSSKLVLPLIPNEILREFEALLNVATTSEFHIQRFLEKHPEILKSLGYVDCKPQVILREPGQRELRPDFLLCKPGNNGFDILDLKLPSASIVRSEPYPRISHEITKAIAQLRAYRNYFTKPANRDAFIRAHSIEYFEPSLIATVGRQHQYPSAVIRNEIQQQSRDVRLMTYDELLEYAKARSIAAVPNDH